MTRRGPEALGVAVAVAAALAGVVLATGSRSPHAVAERRVAWQREVGGLGFGPAVRLEGGSEFDPRVVHGASLEPVPAVGPSFPLPPRSLLPSP